MGEGSNRRWPGRKSCCSEHKGIREFSKKGRGIGFHNNGDRNSVNRSRHDVKEESKGVGNTEASHEKEYRICHTGCTEQKCREESHWEDAYHHLKKTKRLPALSPWGLGFWRGKEGSGAEGCGKEPREGRKNKGTFTG